MNHYQVVYPYIMAVHQTGDRFTALINEGHGSGQDHFKVGYNAAADLRMALASVRFDGIEFGQMSQTAEADIVAVLGIDFARITQTDN